MVRCPKCKVVGLDLHENVPNILIDPTTETVHKCQIDPGEEIIQFGKWAGYTHKESTRIMFSVKRKHEEYLRKREEEFGCGESEPEPVRVLPQEVQDVRSPQRTLRDSFST